MSGTAHLDLYETLGALAEELPSDNMRELFRRVCRRAISRLPIDTHTWRTLVRSSPSKVKLRATVEALITAAPDTVATAERWLRATRPTGAR